MAKKEAPIESGKKMSTVAFDPESQTIKKFKDVAEFFMMRGHAFPYRFRMFEPGTLWAANLDPSPIYTGLAPVGHSESLLYDPMLLPVAPGVRPGYLLKYPIEPNDQTGRIGFKSEATLSVWELSKFLQAINYAYCAINFFSHADRNSILDFLYGYNSEYEREAILMRLLTPQQILVISSLTINSPADGELSGDSNIVNNFFKIAKYIDNRSTEKLKAKLENELLAKEVEAKKLANKKLEYEAVQEAIKTQMLQDEFVINRIKQLKEMGLDDETIKMLTKNAVTDPVLRLMQFDNMKIKPQIKEQSGKSKKKKKS